MSGKKKKGWEEKKEPSLPNSSVSDLVLAMSTDILSCLIAIVKCWRMDLGEKEREEGEGEKVRFNREHS